MIRHNSFAERMVYHFSNDWGQYITAEFNKPHRDGIQLATSIRRFRDDPPNFIFRDRRKVLQFQMEMEMNVRRVDRDLVNLSFDEFDFLIKENTKL